MIERLYVEEGTGRVKKETYLGYGCRRIILMMNPMSQM